MLKVTKESTKRYFRCPLSFGKVPGFGASSGSGLPGLYLYLIAAVTRKAMTMPPMIAPKVEK